MMSTEIQARSMALDDFESDESLTFDVAQVLAVNTADESQVGEFLDRCAADIQRNISVALGAKRLASIAAASATHVAIKSGRLAESGKAKEGQWSNADFAEYLTGRKGVSAQEVSRWRNVARAVFVLGITPDDKPDLYQAVAHKTPAGLGEALTKAIAQLDGKTSKTAIAKAQRVVADAVKVQDADTGGPGTRTPRVPDKMSDPEVFKALRSRVDSYESTWSDAEDDETRAKALAAIAEVATEAGKLRDACEAATRRLAALRAKSDATADEALAQTA